jgi:hypothetical protein
VGYFRGKITHFVRTWVLFYHGFAASQELSNEWSCRYLLAILKLMVPSESACQELSNEWSCQ